MDYILSEKAIKSRKAVFMYEEEEWSGVRKIADRVCEDIKAVFGRKPDMMPVKEAVKDEAVTMPVLFGTAGRCAALTKLEKAGLISVRDIQDKREVYSFTLIKSNEFIKRYIFKVFDFTYIDKRIYGFNGTICISNCSVVI